MTAARSSAVSTRTVVAFDPVVSGVAGLTLLALVLRAVAIGDSLFGDELYTYEIATQPTLGDLFAAIDRTENNPPLFYLLAWGAGKLGDPDVWIRLPSLLIATATAPVVYLLGARAIGRIAGLVGAALFVLSPFAIFFGSEARAYALLMFLVALSSLLLLMASQRRRAGLWIAYAVAAVLAVYAHYTGVLVVAAQAAWAIWALPGRLRELAAVYAGIALAGLGWLPSFLGQDTPALAGFRVLGAAPFSSETVARELLVSLTGHPYLSLREVPGRTALALLGLAAVVAALGRVAAVARPSAATRSGRRWRDDQPLVLVCAVAVAAPAGALAYSVLSTDIFYARNLCASLPGAYLAIAALIASLRRPFLVAAGGLAIAGLLAGVVATLDRDNRRPPFRDAAAFVDDHARPGDPVIQFTFASLSDPLGRILPVHFERDHELFSAAEDEDRGWARGRRGARVFVVIPQVGELAGVPRRSGPGNRFVLRAHRIFPGFTPVGVFEYSKD